jgi:hypothetical protein
LFKLTFISHQNEIEIVKYWDHAPSEQEEDLLLDTIILLNGGLWDLVISPL